MELSGATEIVTINHYLVLFYPFANVACVLVASFWHLPYDLSHFNLIVRADLVYEKRTSEMNPLAIAKPPHHPSQVRAIKALDLIVPGFSVS